MALQIYADWLVNAALPFWLDHGRSAATGLFYEKLALHGAPLPKTPLRTRTQFRQIYVFAHAAALGLGRVDAQRDAAIAAADVMRQRAWNQAGRPGWARAIDVDGRLVDPVVDLYDQACVLLGLCWLAQATGAPHYRLWIDETLVAIDQALAAPGGGWAEDDLGTLPRRQNPHMHLLESALALLETTGEQRFAAMAERLVALFDAHLFDAASGSLREYFGPNWQAEPRWGSDERLEPGHHCEWVWLLRRAERAGIAKNIDVDSACAALLARAKALGTIQPHGLLALETDALGHPRQDRLRLWAQTEYLKALMLQGDMAAADQLAATLLTLQLRPAVPGAWIDSLTLGYATDSADIPASSLYHLFAVLPEWTLAHAKTATP